MEDLDVNMANTASAFRNTDKILGLDVAGRLIRVAAKETEWKQIIPLNMEGVTGNEWLFDGIKQKLSYRINPIGYFELIGHISLRYGTGDYWVAGLLQLEDIDLIRNAIWNTAGISQVEPGTIRLRAGTVHAGYMPQEFGLPFYGSYIGLGLFTGDSPESYQTDFATNYAFPL